jgi:hypothetical protein
MISGPSKGKINVTYTFFANATDLDGDALYYWFDWGDGNNTGWLGPINSGSVMNAKHSWSNKGSFTIKVKAKDTSGLESDWGTLSVTMPSSYEPPQFRFLEWLFERFPHAFPILRQLLGCEKIPPPLFFFLFLSMITTKHES